MDWWSLFIFPLLVGITVVLFEHYFLRPTRKAKQPGQKPVVGNSQQMTSTVSRDRPNPRKPVVRTNTHFEFKRLKELTDYASSVSGLFMDGEKAAKWAELHYDYFEEHDFEKFKKLFKYAHSVANLNMSREAAERWAFQKMREISM